MTERKTKTGFDFKLSGFMEFHPEDLFTDKAKDPKALRTDLEEVCKKHGIENVKWKIDHRDRKTIEEPDNLAGSDMPHVTE